MFSFPTLPPLEGMHPLVVHFPLGLLMIAWVPMLLCVLDKKRRPKWIHTALTLLLIGTIFTFAAVFTGEEAEHIIGSTSQLIEDAVHEHEETAESARNFFILTTVLFAFAAIARKQLAGSKKKPVMIVLGILIAISYALGALALTNAGHQGGVLVHHHNILAPLGNTYPTTTPNNTIRGNNDDNHDDENHQDDD